MIRVKSWLSNYSQGNQDPRGIHSVRIFPRYGKFSDIPCGTCSPELGLGTLERILQFAAKMTQLYPRAVQSI